MVTVASLFQIMDLVGSLDSSRDLQPIHAKSFINRLHLILQISKIPLASLRLHLFCVFADGTKQALIQQLVLPSRSRSRSLLFHSQLPTVLLPSLF
jgi:hypothetical protein